MIDLYCLRWKCSAKNLVISDISFMAIFAEVTENIALSTGMCTICIHFAIYCEDRI